MFFLPSESLIYWSDLLQMPMSIINLYSAESWSISTALYMTVYNYYLEIIGKITESLWTQSIFLILTV